MSDQTGCYHDTPYAIETYTGGRFDVNEPRAEDVDPRDIVHALARIGRYGGHCKRFYSVAEHSIHCHDEARRLGCTDVTCLLCLLHDGGEAYTNDLMRPVKSAPGVEGYDRMTELVQSVVYSRFGLCSMYGWRKADIKRIDNAVLAAEVARLMHGKGRDWNGLDKIESARIPRWKWWWYGLPGRAEAGMRKRLERYGCYP